MMYRKILVFNKQEERDTADLAEIEQRFDKNVEKYLTRSSTACHVGPLALERLIIFEQF